jgi:S1-C subfamily serine protease
LLLAKILRGSNLHNNYLFIAFTGEEKGLFGSNYFCKNPTVDLETVNYMFNMDMVGRLNKENVLALNGVGSSPTFMEALEDIGIDSLKIVTSKSGIGPSDHTSFYLKNIPVIHFFTGQHEDYHRPSDDADKLNYEGLYVVTAYIDSMITHLDGRDKLAFTKTKDESKDTPKFTVTLGVVPDYLFDGKGMRIDGVREGRPAEKAGLLDGDIVIQLGDIQVVDMMSYMEALSKFKKGEATEVTVKRNKENLTFPIQF